MSWRSCSGATRRRNVAMAALLRPTYSGRRRKYGRARTRLRSRPRTQRHQGRHQALRRAEQLHTSSSRYGVSKSSLSRFIPCIMRAIVLLLVIPCAAIHSSSSSSSNKRSNQSVHTSEAKPSHISQRNRPSENGCLPVPYQHRVTESVVVAVFIRMVAGRGGDRCHQSRCPSRKVMPAPTSTGGTQLTAA